MKRLLVLLMIVMPLATQAGESGWGERGNGNEDSRVACKKPGDKIRPILPRPFPDPRIKGSEGEQNCTGENPINDNPGGH